MIPALKITTVARHVHVVRRLIGEGPAFDFVVTVTEHAGGWMLKLHGALGNALTKDEWVAARDRYFPRARAVAFERLARGRGRCVIPLPPPVMPETIGG